MVKSALHDHPVRLSRSVLVCGLLMGLLFSWPLLLLGRPAYLGDSAAYYKGGREAVAFVEKIFTPGRDPSSVAPTSGASAHSGSTPSGDKAPRGARSIAYSVLTYILGAPQAQLILLAIAQALLSGLVSSIVINFFTPASRSRQFLAASVLAFATPVAFVACLALPDIFTGLVALAIILPAVGFDRLSVGVRLLLAGAGIFGVAAHSSHPPLAAGLTLLTTIWLVICWRRGVRWAPWAWLWAAAPLLLGVTLTVATNRVGFGDASIVAKRFPLTLARSIADGPGRWYLTKHCATHQFAICEVYPHGFPDSVPAFLWGETGVERKATPEQMDRIRAEEITIVAAATREYIGFELQNQSISFVRQLVKIRPDATFEQRVELDASGSPRVVPAVGNTGWLGVVIEGASLVATVIALLWLGRRYRSFSRPQQVAILLIVSALLINAAICIFFSGVADRYQARVIWLIPLLALALTGNHRGEMLGSTAQTKSGSN